MTAGYTDLFAQYLYALDIGRLNGLREDPSQCCERSYISGGAHVWAEGTVETKDITVFPCLTSRMKCR